MYLGLDPSTKSTGWAVIGSNGELIDYGVICPPSTMTETQNIALQKTAFSKIVVNNNIRYIICEDQFFGNNVDTLKKLVRVSTVAMIVGFEQMIPLQMCIPAQWRKITHGTGKANKALTRKWVNETFGTSFKAKENDITDAIGIAYACYLQNRD